MSEFRAKRGQSGQMAGSQATSAATAQSGAPIAIEGLGKTFEDNSVIASIDLDIAPGEVVALLGPSGCGKTTLLRLLAGLIAPSAGRIAIGGRDVADATTGRLVPPERRSIGMVFQDYALWPHMSVAGNIAFPLQMRGVGRAERQKRVAEALGLVGLEALAERAPATLSGGQQQRVALARAVVSRPSVVLFDEPLSNLDRELRENLVVDIAALLRSLGLTGVYVTHDHAEAFAVADRVAIMSGGQLIQLAAPEELVAQPANADVAAFLKLGLVAAGQRDGDRLSLSGSEASLKVPETLAGAAGPGHLFVPRAALSLAEADGAPLKGRAVRSLFDGAGYRTRVRLDAGLDVEIENSSRVADDAPLGVAFAWDAARWFPARSTRQSN